MLYGPGISGFGVFELVQILVNIVFPEQESNYIVAVAQQMEAYRKPRYNIPDFLIDRPQCVQAACLANMSGAKEFLLADVAVQGEGKFTITKKQGTNSKKYFVDILGGNCSCYHASIYFLYSIYFHRNGTGMISQNT